MHKTRFFSIFLIVLLASSFLPSFLKVEAQEKTYLKIFEKDGTLLKIPTISLSDSVVSYQDTKEFYQFNVTLSKPPASNIFSFPLETEGLTFYFQPPLDKELDLKEYAFVNATHALNERGEVVVYRPENVVGSYAVYREDGKTGNKYATGKLYHIYTPLIIDAKGNSVWGQLEVTKTSLTITIDEKWLAEATYPIVIDPSFGYTIVGATSDTQNQNQMTILLPNLPEAGTVTEVHAFFETVGTNYGDAKIAFYSWGGTNLDSYEGETNEIIFDSAEKWWNFTSDIELDIGDYGINLWCGNLSAQYYRTRYDTGETGDSCTSSSYTYDGFPSSIGAINLTVQNRLQSIYANYTTGGTPQSVSAELSETCAASASLYTQKSLHRSLTESITITASTYTKKTLIRVAGESTTITTTIESSKGIFTVLTELLETVPTTASIITQKAMHITKIGTLDISAALEVIKHLAATFIVLPEACGISASLQTILPILALTSEEWAMVAIVLSISVSLAICVGLLYSKRRNDYFPYG